MYRNTIGFIAICLMLIAGLMAPCPLWATPAAGEPAAIVNGTPIAKTTVQRQLDAMTNQLARSGRIVDKTTHEAMKQKVLENLIDMELVFQHSQKEGIAASSDQIEEQFAAGKARYPSEAVFKESLNNAGLTEADIRARLERHLTVQDYIRRRVVPNITVTDAQVRGYYDSHPTDFEHPDMVRVSHILIKIDPAAGKKGVADARKTIAEIQTKLKAGGDFAELARTRSQDEKSRSDGGNLGFIGYGQTVPQFEIAAFALAPGQVSDIVQTNYGFHLIKLHERLAAGPDDFNQVADNIRRYLTQEKIDSEMSALADRLRAKATIVRSQTATP